jgi:CheY-like chemotaxis protein/predicted regulator of Ras-like GTPase activity (Roadblock/LC7/MglB family)
MDTILIVDDNKKVLDTLTEGLEIYKSQFEVVMASDGAEAIKILNEHTISLVVTDLMMPNIGGLQLIAYMTKNFQAMPCIVMIGAGTEKKDDNFMWEGVLRCIEKPFKIKEIAALIIDGLDLLDEGATRDGIDLSSFLPLIEMEQVSCLLKIRSATTDSGLLSFEKGIIWGASYRGLELEEAAIEMLTWYKVEISFLEQSTKKCEQRIFSDLKTLIAEARQRKEKRKELENLSIPANDPPIMEIFIGRESERLKNEINTVDDSGGDQIEQEFFLEIKPGKKEEVEEQLSEFKRLKGFMSVGVFSPGGEIVAGIYDHSETYEQTGDLMFDIVRKAQKILKILEFGSCDMIDITAEAGQHLLVQSYHRYNINYLVVLIYRGDAETELFRHHLGLTAPALVEYLKVR